MPQIVRRPADSYAGRQEKVNGNCPQNGLNGGFGHGLKGSI
ncbi:hypothetical protein [Sandaracinobacter neustonicus]|nr:hypothetical protein [Sandaracinobacter neustonicus]